MLRLACLFILLFSTIKADEYDFDMSAIEQKSYEYSGYIRLDNKAQQLQNDTKNHQNYLHLEALLNFSYNYEIFKVYASNIISYDYIESKTSENDSSFNDLYLQTQFNTNHSFLLGKESLGWGKGYFFNPVAFFDRPKDPTQPTQAREGFVIAKYNYNKSFSNDLQNISFDFVYLPSKSSINEDYYKRVTNKEDASNIAMRLYLLLYDTDIDLIYNYSSEASNKLGIDFSNNIQTNFEIHGEYANIIDSGYSYLFGMRYLTDFELTIISEYLYRSMGLTKNEIEDSTLNIPFIAKNYTITLLTQKEPFSWLYSSIYYKNMLNIQDNSMQNKFGVTYAFKNNINIDLSYNINSGTSSSEFGKKQVEDFLWLRLTWNF